MTKKGTFYLTISCGLLVLAIVWKLQGLFMPLPPPDPELIKIMRVMDPYKEKDLEVVYDGIHYPAEAAWLKGREYLSKHYKRGTAAASWIRVYCYRSPDSGIYRGLPAFSPATVRRDAEIT